MPRVPRDSVLHLYDEGVRAFEAAAAGLPPDGWDLTACGEWTAAELARHVLAVAGWYHEWLDRAERGDAAPAFGVEELGAHNARALAELAHLDGPAAVGQFVARARAYGGPPSRVMGPAVRLPTGHGHRRTARRHGGL